MSDALRTSPRVKPALDPHFVPAILWVNEYRRQVRQSGEAQDLALALEREGGTVSTYRTQILPYRPETRDLNNRFIERLVKFLLWARGGFKMSIAGPGEAVTYLREVYHPRGQRSFDHSFFGDKVYSREMVIESSSRDELPADREDARQVGGHFDGCRVGFDLGGSDRKCAAVRDGEVVHTEEVEWDPYTHPDPDWHLEHINDSIQRAASKLPRVDAIGGSSAGIYIDNKVRVASLFRGVPEADFEARVRPIFSKVRARWNNVPLVVINDGDVTALSGAMALEETSFLGLAMGTSLAAGYVDENGKITGRLNELAFVPVDYREGAPIDEWSRDHGCGVQYFSQQAVARLLEPAGIELAPGLSDASKLVEVQKLMEAGDERARKIYETMGAYLGYTIAWFSEFYTIAHLLLLGRVMTGSGEVAILETAKGVLSQEFPDLFRKLQFHEPSEREKRHGQAVAAASLPALEK